MVSSSVFFLVLFDFSCLFFGRGGGGRRAEGGSIKSYSIWAWWIRDNYSQLDVSYHLISNSGSCGNIWYLPVGRSVSETLWRPRAVV